MKQAKDFKAICLFVNQKLNEAQIDILKQNKNKLILCCSAGFDNIPLQKVKTCGIRVARVPSYSPSSIAEYAVSSILTLSKNLQKSYELTKKADFTICGLQCILLEDKVAGVIGTGLIGRKTAEKISGLVSKVIRLAYLDKKYEYIYIIFLSTIYILIYHTEASNFSTQVICYDAYPDNEWMKSIPNAEYVELEQLLSHSNVISIHVPLLKETHHMINESAISKMKDDVILANTSRGEVVKTSSIAQGLKSGKIFGVALDVFEGEKELIFKDMTRTGFKNHPELQELSCMNNVIMSSHIAFYTDESVRQITEKTFQNFKTFVQNEALDEKAFVI